MRRNSARALGAALLCFSLAGAADVTTARAAGDDPAALAKAREEYRKGLSLEQSGDFTRALETFKGVALVKSNANVRYHIGFCQEKLGDYVQALGSYKLALSEVAESKSKDVEPTLRDAIASLEPRIPKLTIKRGEGAAVADVVLDGAPVGNAAVGTALSVNPGPHSIRASAPDKEPGLVEITLAESEKKEVVLTLVQKAVVKPIDTAPTATVAPTQAPPPKTSPMKVVGFVTGGLGVVSLGMSAVFFAMRGSAISELDAECGPTRQACPAGAKSTADRGALMSTLTSATFIGGLGALGIGAIIVIAAPSSKKAQPAVGLVPVAPQSQAGASFVGRF